MSSELVDRIRQKYADDLKVLEEKPWVLDPKQCEYPETWQETADVRDLLVALEQAERALGEAQTTIESQYRNLRAELETLRTQLAQTQTDLAGAGAEATAETLRLALAECQEARDTHLEDRQRQYERANTAWAAVAEAEQRGRALSERARDRWITMVRLLSAADGPHPVQALQVARAELAALTPPEGSTLCGVKGCTLPSTHGDEPHSWEPPTGGPPPEGSAAEGSDG